MTDEDVTEASASYWLELLQDFSQIWLEDEMITSAHYEDFQQFLQS